MTISAKVIAYSMNQRGNPLVTVQLRYPRFIHAELMTHRVFSRNASSSRAIPVERLIKDILEDTAMPLHWGKNQPGMQADEECDNRINVYADGLDDPAVNETREHAWKLARDQAVRFARAFDAAGYHKQIVNRLLEPFSHINVLVTASEWSNFFALRRHKDAQPEIHALADAIWEAMAVSTYDTLKPGEWHLPYITYEEKKLYDQEVQLRCSVARCARVSYLTTEGTKPSVEQDQKLYERLVGSVPLHASPAEHQATPDVWVESGYVERYGWRTPEKQRNFVGWIQYRSLLPGDTQ